MSSLFSSARVSARLCDAVVPARMKSAKIRVGIVLGVRAFAVRAAREAVKGVSRGVNREL